MDAIFVKLDWRCGMRLLRGEVCWVLFLVGSVIFANWANARSFLETRFTDIYDEKFWQWRDETVSGVGSSLAYTEKIRRELPALYNELGVTSVLDAACGDFNWMQYVRSPGIAYIGVDIVKELIENNKQKYESPNISFVQADITKDALPRVDLILSRDCFAHLAWRDTLRVLRNFKKSGSKYLLVTTYTSNQRSNENIVNKVGYGNYPINLENPPFNFPPPLYVILEDCPHGEVADKCLALWRLEDLDLRQKSAVTYLDKWSGRLGDNLLMYIKAKWIAWSMGMPFYYKPFKYSDQFMLHDLDIRWEQTQMENFLYVENLGEKKEGCQDWYINIQKYIKRDAKILYVVHYLFQPYNWGTVAEEYESQEITMWQDMMANEEFRQELGRVLSPRVPMENMFIPENKITVAVHVRKGGGFDKPLLSLQSYGGAAEKKCVSCYCDVSKKYYADINFPLKFPPDAFYIDQIQKISKRFRHAPMYVHIFTDDPDPVSLTEGYKAAVGLSNIEFGCRKEGNHHDKNVLEDLFAMARFDCLIRSGSNFPQIAQLIGNHQVVIYPKNAEWRSQLYISEVGIEATEDN